MCAVFMFYFFRTCCFEVLYSQLWNVLHFYVPDGKCNKNRRSFWIFHHLHKESCFSSFLSCFKQCVLGLSGLLGLNAVIILPLYYNAIIVWSLEMFCAVSQAFISLLVCWQKGVQFCAWMYWVPLWWFVKSTLSCPTAFSFVYCYVIN